MLIILLTLISYPFFFYKLGQSSLGSWDEAWYAEIAKQMGLTGDVFVMHFNGMVFTDHPPAGFWLIRISHMLFGVNEFGTQAPSALFGIICLIGVYLLGKKLFNRTVGLTAALALLSAPWFLVRARSGNLDIFLVTFFVYTIYFAILANENSSRGRSASGGKKYLTHFFVSLTFLFLTKTMVPFTVIPALLIIFFGNKSIKFSDLKIPVGFFAILTGAWVFANSAVKPDFVDRYFQIGLPGVKKESDILANVKIFKEYLHSGIGKWFWPGIIGLVGGLIAFQKRFLVLAVMTVSLAAPFIFSAKGHIWHMIPIYPFLLLLLFGFGYALAKKVIRVSFLANLAILVFCLVFFIPQARANWYNIVDIDAYVADEAILSREAGKHPEDFYIDDDFFPVAIFYSNKSVKKVNVTLLEHFEKFGSFVLITKEQRMIDSGVSPEEYEILAKDRDKVLVRSNR